LAKELALNLQKVAGMVSTQNLFIIYFHEDSFVNMPALQSYSDVFGGSRRNHLVTMAVKKN